MVVTDDRGRASAKLEPEALLDERFRSFAACADDTIVITDLNAAILFINDAGRRLVDAAPERDLVGTNAFELVARESRADAADALRRALADGVARGLEFLIARPDGTRVAVEMTASVMRDGGGAPVGYMSIMRDVSARRREQEKTAVLLDTSRAISGRLEVWEILDKVQKRASGALGCDAVATFFWEDTGAAFQLASHYSPGGESIFQPGDLSFRRDVPWVDRLANVRTVVINDVASQDWVPPDVLRLARASALAWTQLVVQNKAVGALVALHTREGAAFDEDQVELFEGIAQQLALGIEAAELYQKSQREAETASALARELHQANRTKSDFVAAIAHELRSPLSVITGYGSLLLDGAFGDLTEEQVDVVQRIDRTTATLTELVNTLLDFSRLESGQLGVQLQHVDVQTLLALVDEETSELRSRHPEVAFRLEAEAGLPLLYTDPLKLKVVLKNLIGNALKFTDHGEVSLCAVAAEGGVDIAVSDTGVGIPKESLAVIFDPFRQGADIRKAHGGFGLGLYIVRRLLDLLGGRVRVESEAGRGTTFVVFVPAS